MKNEKYLEAKLRTAIYCFVVDQANTSFDLGCERWSNAVGCEDAYTIDECFVGLPNEKHFAEFFTDSMPIYIARLDASKADKERMRVMFDVNAGKYYDYAKQVYEVFKGSLVEGLKGLEK